jgi:peptide/nickel transport system substrate-binding protein
MMPQYGGTLRMIANYTYTENMGYPPIHPPSFNGFIPAPAIEALLRVNPDTGLPDPFLVTGWKWADDNSSIDLTLQQGVKFHDGTDFNAQSVKYMLDAYTPTSPDLADVTLIEVIDDYTLRFNTSRYSNTLLYDLACKAGAAGVISASSVKLNGGDWSVTHGVGTGPFKQVSFQRSVGVKYERFDDYWQEGKPYLDAVDITFITDPLTAKLSFMAGEGNAVVGIRAADSLDLSATGKYNIVSYPLKVNILAPDASNPESPFSKLEVRQAVSYAIDVPSLLEAYGYGTIPYTNQVLYPTSIGYNPNVVGYPYNPAKAKELLTQAGYPDGFDTTIYYQAGLGYDNALIIAQRYLADVGIQAELQPVGSARRSELVFNGWPTNSMVYFGNFLTAGFTSAKSFVNYYSNEAPTLVSMLRPNEIQSLIESMVGEQDESKMISDLQQLNTLWVDKYCLGTPLCADINVGALDKSIQDSYLLDPTMENWTPENTWIKK